MPAARVVGPARLEEGQPAAPATQVASFGDSGESIALPRRGGATLSTVDRGLQPRNLTDRDRVSDVQCRALRIGVLVILTESALAHLELLDTPLRRMLRGHL